MKILFVAAAFDVQTASWISHLNGMGHEIHLFDPNHGLIHPDLRGITYHTGWAKLQIPHGVQVDARWPLRRGKYFLQKNFQYLWQKIVPKAPVFLREILNRIQPEVVHCLGMQDYGYVIESVYSSGHWPPDIPLIYTCKGSDIFYFGNLEEHKNRIERFLRICDHMVVGCVRDRNLATNYGFCGNFLGIFPGMGSFDIDSMQRLKSEGCPSERRIVAVKGLQHQVGRALDAVEALEKCVADVSGLEFWFFQAHPEVREKAVDFGRRTGIPVHILPRCSPEEVYSLFGRSRVVLGVSESDGVPNAMIEAMIMGALPIQTDPGGATAEWIAHGENGLTIPVIDVNLIAVELRRALADDELVDSASKFNLALAKRRVDRKVLLPKIQAIYDGSVNLGKVV